MIDVKNNLNNVQLRIEKIANKCERDPKQITLIAVSKTKPVTLIEQAIASGQYQFGENYVQEGVTKIEHFQAQANKQPISWHFIGPLQSNKTKYIAEYFDWIHTIDRLKIAQRLNEQRPKNKDKLNVLIQINISDENSKSGIHPNEMFSLAEQISLLPNLTLRGLMAIPAIETDSNKQLAVFQQMATLFTQLKTTYTNVDTLSMGMSDDMESAILAGSTMIRIGSAIFGARDYS